ncbi:MAG TPA: hypothetical protein VJJ47_00480 [Candidatus Paceibacterota bacterium]
MTSSRSRRAELRIGLAIIGIFLLYAAWNARQLLAGPELVVESPVDQATVSAAEPVVTLTGFARRGISELRVNGGRSFVDADGRFSETYALLPGENHFTVVATDRFGREAGVTRTVWLLSPGEAPVAASSAS